MSYPYELDDMYNSEKPSADGLGRLSFGTSSGGNKGKMIWRSLSFQATKSLLYYGDDGLVPVDSLITVPAHFTLDIEDSVCAKLFTMNALPEFSCSYERAKVVLGEQVRWSGVLGGFWWILDGPSGFTLASLTGIDFFPSEWNPDYLDYDIPFGASFISKSMDIYTEAGDKVGQCKINCYVNGSKNTDPSYVPVNTTGPDSMLDLYRWPFLLVKDESLVDTLFAPNNDEALWLHSLPLEYFLYTLEDPYQGIYPYYRSLPDLAEAIVEDLQEGDLTVEQCLDLLRNHLLTVIDYNDGEITGYMWKIENDILYVNMEYNSILVFDKPVQE